MVGVMRVYSALLQIPGAEGVPEESFSELVSRTWDDLGIMGVPLSACIVVGLIVIVWKFFDLYTKSARTKIILGEVDVLLDEHRVDEALEATRNSDTPAAKILYAGLDRDRKSVV